jgi:ADP-heptose:LPS heptosyltransferase
VVNTVKRLTLFHLVAWDRNAVQQKLLKFLDQNLGPLVVRLMGSSCPATTGSLQSVLFIRPGGIGDAVLLIPAISAFKEQFPATFIEVLAEKRNSATFSLCPAVAAVHCYDEPRSIVKFFRRRYDLVIDSEQWSRLSAVIACLCGDCLIGFATNDRRRLFSHAISYCQDSYEIELFFALLAPLVIDPPTYLSLPFLTVPHAAQLKSAKVLAGFAPLRVVIFPGASITERRWGVEQFRDLAQRIHATGGDVVVVGGKEDRQLGEEIVGDRGGINLAGRTSLVETAAVIKQSTLLVSGDSGVLHIAVGLDKPTVSLFGPGIAKKWAPRGEKHIVLNKHLPCSPCTKFGYTPKCKIKAKCMSDITVDEVFAAVMRQLDRYGGRNGEQDK